MHQDNDPNALTGSLSQVLLNSQSTTVTLKLAVSPLAAVNGTCVGFYHQMKDHEHSCFVSIITALRTWEAHNAVLQFTVNLKGKFPKGLCAYVQPHIFEPYNIVLAEWEIAHTEFHRGTTSSPHPDLNTV